MMPKDYNNYVSPIKKEFNYVNKTEKFSHGYYCLNNNIVYLSGVLHNPDTFINNKIIATGLPASPRN